MAIIVLPWSFYRAHRRLYDKSKQNRLKNENANNYDKSKQNTIKTRYANKHSFHYVQLTPASWTPACLNAGPAVPKCCRRCSHHSWKIFLPLFAGMVSNSRTNIQLTKTSFFCANERFTRRRRSVNAVKAQ